MSGVTDFLTSWRDDHAPPAAAVQNLSAADRFALPAGQQCQDLCADNGIRGTFTECTKRLIRIPGGNNVMNGSIDEFLNILIYRKG